MTRRCRAACLALLLVLPVTVSAQDDRWAREVEQRLARLRETLAPQGYRLVGRVVAGELFVDESRQVPLATVRGTAYLVGAICDADCTGLALVLSDASGYQVDAARAPVPAPVVRLGAEQPRGPYRLTVTLTGCQVSPCRYAVELFERRPAKGGNLSRRGAAGRAG